MNLVSALEIVIISIFSWYLISSELSSQFHSWFFLLYWGRFFCAHLHLHNIFFHSSSKLNFFSSQALSFCVILYSALSLSLSLSPLSSLALSLLPAFVLWMMIVIIKLQNFYLRNFVLCVPIFPDNWTIDLMLGPVVVCNNRVIRMKQNFKHLNLAQMRVYRWSFRWSYFNLCAPYMHNTWSALHVLHCISCAFAGCNPFAHNLVLSVSMKWNSCLWNRLLLVSGKIGSHKSCLTSVLVLHWC